MSTSNIANKQKNSISNQAYGIIDRAALSKIARIGDLYDARKDAFCGPNIFNDDLTDLHIKTTPTPNTEFDYVYTNSTSEKFKKLDINAQLKVSILAGMVSIDGSAKYIDSKSSSAREACTSLVTKIKTVHEALRTKNTAVKKLISEDAIHAAPNATHVVTGIQYGAAGTITLKCKTDKIENKTAVEESLKARLKKIVRIDGGVDVDVENKSTENKLDIRLEYTIDAIQTNRDAPQSVDEAVALVKELPKLISNSNGGKGVPVSYTLTPLSTFIPNIKIIANMIDEGMIEEAVRIMDEMNESRIALNDVYEDYQQQACITNKDLLSIENFREDLRASQGEMKEKLREAVQEIRNGESDSQLLNGIIEKYKKMEMNKAGVREFIDSLSHLREKIDYVSHLRNNSAHYIGKGMSLDTERNLHDITRYYIFFCNWDYNDESYLSNKQIFTELVRKIGHTCILMDISIHLNANARENVPSGNRICFYERGSYTNTDYKANPFVNDDALFYLAYSSHYEGRICLFNSITFEVEIVGKFSIWVNPYKVATGNDQIFLIDGCDRVFEIFNYETKQLTRGPDPPEWRRFATVAYYKNKLYYIGGYDSNKRQDSTSVNILVNGKWQRGPDFPINTDGARHVICNDKLYIIWYNAVFQLSDDEREWIEVGKMEKNRYYPAVASLNGKIYITGGADRSLYGNTFNSCLCFDPSQPFDRRFTPIANMNHDRRDHSLVVANGKMYAIGGGYQKICNTTLQLLSSLSNFCKSVEEYDPAINRWRTVKKIE